MLFAVCIGSAKAGTVTLWYSGDADSLTQDEYGNYIGTGNGLISQYDDPFAPTIVYPYAMVYDDFTLSTVGWNVQEVWANQALVLLDPPEAYWEIRSGVSNGDGGTLVASGTSASSFTATGGSPLLGYPEYRVDISGLDVTLVAPGTYWLGIAPVDDSGALYYDEVTSGLNAIVPADNGNSFFDSFGFGYTFVAAGDSSFPLGPGAWDFSMGVAGELGGVVIPEPATLSLLGLGLDGLIAKVARRKNR
jgi:hypothetical protein